MKLPLTVTQFSIETARYQISDAAGTQALLVVDDANNLHSLEADGPVSSALRSSASVIANDLLARKHGVNFANPSRATGNSTASST